MATFNKVLLLGNLTRDPELRYLPSGTAIATFGLAVNHRYQNSEGEVAEDTTFVDITTFGKTAENCTTYLSKGRPVFVEGRLRYHAWETEEGQKRSKLEVVANNVQFLNGSPKSNDVADFDDSDDKVGKSETDEQIPF